MIMKKIIKKINNNKKTGNDFAEEELKFLEFLQNIIERNNTNSFQLKSMAVTIDAAILAIYLDRNNELILLVSIIITLIFWFIDAKYLKQERQFREVYNSYVDDRTSIQLFKMPINKFADGECSYISSLFSITITPLYFGLIIIFIVLLFLKYNDMSIISLLKEIFILKSIN